MKLLVFILLILVAPVAQATDHPTLPIGAAAPSFSLTGVDGKQYSLASFQTARILVIVFTCNHCPTAQAYEDRLNRFAADYKPKGVAVVAICSNNPASIRLDELGYTDLGDSFDDMKIRAREKKFIFPYLYDGDSQLTAEAYGPVATPHVFIFDNARKLRYQGRFDDHEKPGQPVGDNSARDATDALLAGKEPAVTTTKVFGCSIKWSDKSAGVRESDEEWAKEPVTLQNASAKDLKDLLQNKSDKLRLINVWATWCGPCVTEFPQLVSINRMYRQRDFEFITVSADDPSKKDRVEKFLTERHAANANYLYTDDNKYRLIEAIDSAWNGALPYTLLVEPGGKIVYRRSGPVNMAALKTAIVDNRLLGRYY